MEHTRSGHAQGSIMGDGGQAVNVIADVDGVSREAPLNRKAH